MPGPPAHRVARPRLQEGEIVNKASAEGLFGYFRMVLGMSRRLVEQFPADKLGYRPAPETRTVAEILSHNYTFLLDAVETIHRGSHVQSEEPKIGDKTELLAWMDAQVEKTFAVFAKLTDAQLEKRIAAYGDEFAGWQFLSFAYDEHWHHRGQLTVYLRLLGVKPIMIYDYHLLQQA